MYKSILKPLLFLISPEKAHYFSTGILGFLLAVPGMKYLFEKLYRVNHPSLERELFGLKFPNPVGLAAGFDKNATMFRNLGHLGFGFIEIGTVTPLAQVGNPSPRLFRLPKDNALINRMGFNNLGLDHAIEQLKNRNKDLIIGGNIGKNKVTPNENAKDDYIICFNGLFDYVDYFVVNVSSPNTPNLRDLQEKGPLLELLNALMDLNSKKPSPKPILLKIAPDLTEGQLNDVVEIVLESKIAGLIATNTTIDRSNLNTSTDEVDQIGAGGLSGMPLKNSSTEVIRYINTKSGAAFPIIGVGGIASAKDAQEKLDAGASLVQIYTGFVYEGPGIVARINRKLIS